MIWAARAGELAGFGDRSQFVITGNDMRDLANWSECRAEVGATIKTTIDLRYNFVFKVGAIDRYVINSQVSRPIDVQYFAVLAWRY